MNTGALAVESRYTLYVRARLSWSHLAGNETLIELAVSEVTVGSVAAPLTCGPRLFGATELTAKRTRPSCGVLLTLGNSPPSTVYLLFAATVQAACDLPVIEPTSRFGHQLVTDGLGLP